MKDKIQIFWVKNKKQLFDARNIGLYIFTIIILAITWSTIKTIQNNYELQKQISAIKQQNDVLDLQNQTINLKNKYIQTDQYLDLAARQNLGLAGPGEKVLLVPRSVALKYLDPSVKLSTSSSGEVAFNNQSKYSKNIEDWRDFLLGREPATQ